MLAVFLSLALADYDGGYDSGCDAPCAECTTCLDLTCETEQEDLGRELECRGQTGDDDDEDGEFSIWCDCGSGDDDDDDTTTGDDDDAPEDDADKGGACGGCSAAPSPVAVFGVLALLSGGLLLRRRSA